MWNGWPLNRVVILFTALGFGLIFIQVTLMHYRQNFHHWSQWLPVIALPVLALNAFTWLLSITLQFEAYSPFDYPWIY